MKHLTADQLTEDQLHVLKMIRDAPEREANAIARFLQFGLEDYVYYVPLCPESDIKHDLDALLTRGLIEKMPWRELYRITYFGRTTLIFTAERKRISTDIGSNTQNGQDAGSCEVRREPKTE